MSKLASRTFLGEIRWGWVHVYRGQVRKSTGQIRKSTGQTERSPYASISLAPSSRVPTRNFFRPTSKSRSFAESSQRKANQVIAHNYLKVTTLALDPNRK